MINDYKILKELGHGMFGSVYLAEKGGKKYALKIEKISDDKVDLRKSLWREIDFYEKFSRFFPNYFSQLIEYGILDRCKFKPKIINKISLQNLESKYCSIKIYSLIDKTLDKLKLRQNEYYSILIQLLYAIYLMNKAGYVHGDLHKGNIGVVRVDRKYVKIFGRRVRTYGRAVRVIDFGTVLHPSYDMRNEERDLYMLGRDKEMLWAVSNMAYDYEKFMRGVLDGLGGKNDLNDMIVRFEGSKRDRELREYTSNIYYRYQLFMLMYPDEFVRFVFGRDVGYEPIEFFLPMEDILYVVRNSGDMRGIINYFIDKLDKN